jgi:ABC-type nitrate/sulfonate/bicarbonate transport system permease component
MSERLRLKRAFLRHPGLARLAVVIGLFALWEIVARVWIDPTFLSPPVARSVLARRTVRYEGDSGGAADHLLGACGRVLQSRW